MPRCPCHRLAKGPRSTTGFPDGSCSQMGQVPPVLAIALVQQSQSLGQPPPFPAPSESPPRRAPPRISRGRLGPA
eukprot:1726221-Alexandrium_andersonii.AAC.1